jgi:hypothetical protein
MDIANSNSFMAAWFTFFLFQEVREQQRKEIRTVGIYLDMGRLFIELVRDGISREEWEKWLPLFVEADRGVALYPKYELEPISDLVIEMIEVSP